MARIAKSLAANGPDDTTKGSFLNHFMYVMDENPTIFHFCNAMGKVLAKAGFEYLDEREDWTSKLQKGGSFFTTRNGSSLIAFKVGELWEPGKGIGLVGTHQDEIHYRLKPISILPEKDGYLQISVAPYSSPPLSWMDRDLGLAGRVLIKTAKGVSSKLIKFPGPVGRIPTLAEHFGTPSEPPFNPETQMMPIVGLVSAEGDSTPTPEEAKSVLAGKHDIRLLRRVAELAGCKVQELVQLELEFFSFQPSSLGGLDGEFLFMSRLDDKLCSYAALMALCHAKPSPHTINMVASFDNEEIGSQTRQGAGSNLVKDTVGRILSGFGIIDDDIKGQTGANSFLVSSDVAHAVNPNFSNEYATNYKPKLNTGMVVKTEQTRHNYVTDFITLAFVDEVVKDTEVKLQNFQIKNGARSGGTIGPMLSTNLGWRGVETGIPQLSMHSCRAATGSRDVALGVEFYKAFFEKWYEVDQKFIAGGL